VSIPDPVTFVESRFGIQLKKVGPTEYAGPCPWCSHGNPRSDRFHVWTRGNYACMRPEIPGHCGRSGWLDELDGSKPLTKDELLELRVAALERKQQDHERRLSALEKMHECQDHYLYHKNLNDNEFAVDYWLSEGITYHSIARYKLGYCRSCPTAPDHDSYTIPVMAGGKLYNIRHRLRTPNDGGKYRPHMSGLPAMLFGYDDISREDDHRIIIAEGEKKAIVLAQEVGIPVVATMGMQSFKPEWASKFPPRFTTIYVAYDPDATERAVDVARLFGKRARVLHLPCKADDFFSRYHGTKEDFLMHTKTARPV
jgi:hypothetical protein